MSVLCVTRDEVVLGTLSLSLTISRVRTVYTCSSINDGYVNSFVASLFLGALQLERSEHSYV